MKKKLKKLFKISPLSIYEALRDYEIKKKRDEKNRELIKKYLERPGKKKLQLGCGSNFLDGWLNSDINGVEGTFHLDAGSQFPLENETFDFIYSEHLFEHLTFEQQMKMIQEARRILKKGGVFRIATPSLDFLFSLYNKPNAPENYQYLNWAKVSVPNLKSVYTKIDSDYIHIYTINNFFRDWGHKMIHNFESLKELLISVGFSTVKGEEVGKSEHDDLKNIEQHGNIIPDHINKMETIIIECIK